MYCETSNISHIMTQNLNVSRLVLQLSFLLNQVLSREWRWLINNFISYYNVDYITGLNVYFD